MNKYEKRLHRLMFMYFMDIFKKNSLTNFTDIQTYIMLCSQVIKQTVKLQDQTDEIRDIQNKFEDVLFTNFLLRINKMINQISIEDDYNTVYNNYYEMHDMIMTILYIFHLTIGNNKNFCNKKNRIYFNDDLYIH